MSTRATYRFDNPDRFTAKPTIYIHHDGYEAGAAVYFYQTLTNPSKGCFGTQFIRANGGAELTQSNDCHGDTEYRYEVRGNGADAELMAYKRNWSAESESETKWQMVYCGSLLAFIDKHHEMIEDYKPFKMVQVAYGSRLLNEVTARQLIEGRSGPLHHLRIWSQHNTMPHHAANWQSCVRELQSIVKEFPALVTDEINGFVSESEVTT